MKQPSIRVGDQPPFLRANLPPFSGDTSSLTASAVKIGEVEGTEDGGFASLVHRKAKAKLRQTENDLTIPVRLEVNRASITKWPFGGCQALSVTVAPAAPGGSRGAGVDPGR
jgi:hypothetical protein